MVRKHCTFKLLLNYLLTWSDWFIHQTHASFELTFLSKMALFFLILDVCT